MKNTHGAKTGKEKLEHCEKMLNGLLQNKGTPEQIRHYKKRIRMLKEFSRDLR